VNRGIRTATRTDADSIRAIYEPIVLNTFVSFESEPPEVEEMARRISSGHLWLVSEHEGRIVGYAYAARFNVRAAYRWSVEVSVYVDEAHRRSGIGRSLMSSLLTQLAERGFVNAFAGIALPNPGSVRLVEALGFDHIGLQRKVGFKLGEWRDVGWWQLRLREPTVPPPPLKA
jgi:phosphinothricin acetyltransferase